MSRGALLTVTEAAFVLEEPIRRVKKELDQGPIQPAFVAKAGGRVRALDRMDLIYFLALRELRAELTPKARTEFYAALRRSVTDRPRSVGFGRLQIDLSDLAERVEERMQRLKALSDQIEFREDGEPLIHGTAIEAHRIAALLDGGASAEEVLADYPSLSRQQVLAARAYAEAYPKPGRPFPRVSAKRALAEAGLDLLDALPQRRGSG